MLYWHHADPAGVHRFTDTAFVIELVTPPSMAVSWYPLTYIIPL